MSSLFVGDSIILDDQYNADYEPTVDEVENYAEWLGMDLNTDRSFLWIAREALKAPLPEFWKPCQPKDSDDHYYFNFKTGESSWHHPSDSFYRTMFEQKRKEILRNKQLARDKVKSKIVKDAAQILDKSSVGRNRSASLGCHRPSNSVLHGVLEKNLNSLGSKLPGRSTCHLMMKPSIKNIEPIADVIESNNQFLRKNVKIYSGNRKLSVDAEDCALSTSSITTTVPQRTVQQLVNKDINGFNGLHETFEENQTTLSFARAITNKDIESDILRSKFRKEIEQMKLESSVDKKEILKTKIAPKESRAKWNEFDIQHGKGKDTFLEQKKLCEKISNLEFTLVKKMNGEILVDNKLRKEIGDLNNQLEEANSAFSVKCAALSTSEIQVEKLSTELERLIKSNEQTTLQNESMKCDIQVVLNEKIGLKQQIHQSSSENDSLRTLNNKLQCDLRASKRNERIVEQQLNSSNAEILKSKEAYKHIVEQLEIANKNIALINDTLLNSKIAHSHDMAQIESVHMNITSLKEELLESKKLYKDIAEKYELAINTSVPQNIEDEQINIDLKRKPDDINYSLEGKYLLRLLQLQDDEIVSLKEEISFLKFTSKATQFNPELPNARQSISQKLSYNSSSIVSLTEKNDERFVALNKNDFVQQDIVDPRYDPTMMLEIPNYSFQSDCTSTGQSSPFSSFSVDGLPSPKLLIDVDCANGLINNNLDNNSLFHLDRVQELKHSTHENSVNFSAVGPESKQFLSLNQAHVNQLPSKLFRVQKNFDETHLQKNENRVKIARKQNSKRNTANYNVHTLIAESLPFGYSFQVGNAFKPDYNELRNVKREKVTLYGDTIKPINNLAVAAGVEKYDHTSILDKHINVLKGLTKDMDLCMLKA